MSITLEQELKEVPAKYKKVIATINFGGKTIVRFEGPLVPLDEPITKAEAISMVEEFINKAKIEVKLTTALLALDYNGAIGMQEIVPAEFK